MAEKRTRAPNFSKEEKLLLLQLAEKHKHILECKKTDGVTWREKDLCWKNIMVQFNASTPALVQRTDENLKKLYENIKKAQESRPQQIAAIYIKLVGVHLQVNVATPYLKRH
ncbi:hypothetical protein Zmor_003657 [Zophobas morio]|uniref:Regulatory protein zeste n=1 Tax=Zophobas morio TaxID=2755281 RepID=A0AA38M1J7_9CUCU|nr:hypothetical protein Zmor_003657 [Zophobas morio]